MRHRDALQGHQDTLTQSDLSSLSSPCAKHKTLIGVEKGSPPTYMRTASHPNAPPPSSRCSHRKGGSTRPRQLFENNDELAILRFTHPPKSFHPFDVPWTIALSPPRPRRSAYQVQVHARRVFSKEWTGGDPGHLLFARQVHVPVVIR
jgi:hypothetical protein